MLLAAALLSTGCIGSAGDDTQGLTTAGTETAEARQTATAAPPVRILQLEGRFLAEAANTGLAGAIEAEPRAIEVPDVPVDATAIVAELTWEGTGDLEVDLLAPTFCPEGPPPKPLVDWAVCRTMHHATGQSQGAYGTDRTTPALDEAYLRVEVDRSTIGAERCGQARCDWWVQVHPNLAVDTAFDLRVSVFTGEGPGDGYSAFP